MAGKRTLSVLYSSTAVKIGVGVCLIGVIAVSCGLDSKDCSLFDFLLNAGMSYSESQ